jgi:peptidoglycan/xylan/chitin deacetylase (PgdA/CDA1 family)
MRLGLSLRQWARQLIISGTTALHLDEVERRRERVQTSAGQPPIRVLFLHATPDAGALRALLQWVQRHFEIIDFPTFEGLFQPASARPLPRPAVLLTFDDGLASNYRIAAPVLEEAGARGLFFVVPGFSTLSGDAARRFYAERIRGESFELPMRPDQIADLSERGHTIGNHTFSHAWLSQTHASQLEREIEGSAALLESWTRRPVDAFAWPFVWNGITTDAYRLAIACHRYCFSPCAGRVVPGADAPGLIWRTNVETWSRVAELRFQCSALADRASADRRWRLRQLLRAQTPSASQAA